MIAADAPVLYRLLQTIILGLLRLLTRTEITGVERVPASGPLVIAPNHLHLFDSPLLFAVVPRRLTVMAADKWRYTPVGPLLSLVGKAIYVHRGQPDRPALSRALAVLQAGGAMAVAPEGTRSQTGELQPGKDGAAYLASRAGAVILPVAAWGQEQALRLWAHGRRPEIHIQFGEPIHLPAGSSQARSGELHGYTEELMLSLARMLPAGYRGVYSGRI